MEAEEYYVIDYNKAGKSIDEAVPEGLSDEDRSIAAAMLAVTSKMIRETKNGVLLMFNIIDPQVISPIDLANYLMTIWDKHKVRLFLTAYAKFNEENTYE